MYLATFSVRNRLFLGCRIGGDLLRFDKAYEYCFGEAPPVWMNDMRSFLTQGETAMERVRKLRDTIKRGLSIPGRRERLVNQEIVQRMDDVHVMAPILNPEKIICIGLNYRDHCMEQNIPTPKNPVLFSKFPTAIIGPDDEIVRPKSTVQLDYEGELAFVIGRRGKHIPLEDAMDHVAGYTIMNDISARDIQFSDGQWLRGKTYDTFAPLGPFLVTKDEVENPNRLGIEVTLNGELMQNSNTENMIFDIPYLVNFISTVVHFSPGDVVSTGTPAGVGVFRQPRVFLKERDEVTVEIETLGVLRNRVVDEKPM